MARRQHLRKWGPLVTDEEWNNLVDAYRAYLNGRGPEPDLGRLSREDQASITEQFDIIRALSDRGPELPSIEEDPVAIRLGLAGNQKNSPGEGS